MLKDKVESELKKAMKSREDLRLSVFRLLSSAIHNKEIEKRTRAGGDGGGELSDEEVVQTIRSELKKRKDAAAAYRRGGRPDSAAKEEAEGEILSELLPPELADGELIQMIEQGLEELGISSEKDFGRLMGWVMNRAGGRASADRVMRMVKGKLSGRS